MIFRIVTRQHDSRGRQPGPVTPHSLLQEGRTRLRLADVHVDAGMAVARLPTTVAGGRDPPWPFARCQPDTSQRIVETSRRAHVQREMMDTSREGKENACLVSPGLSSSYLIVTERRGRSGNRTAPGGYGTQSA